MLNLLHMTRWLWTVLVIAGFLSCREQPKVSHSFYHWKTGPEFRNRDSSEERQLQKLGLDHIYVHYLDVDWSENLGIPVPRTQLSPNSLLYLHDLEYTPVVFITNRTFQRISDEWCDSLAVKLAKRVDELTASIETRFEHQFIFEVVDLPYDSTYQQKVDSIREDYRLERSKLLREIQIDCDWTAGTKELYFRFLRRFKELHPDKTISATIRMYPYKYPDKTGVPPVDRGMLMCYNLGDIRSVSTYNSVFDYETFTQYLTDKEYPIELDVALPLFGWYAWFRGREFKGIIYEREGIPMEQVPALAPEKGNRWKVRRDTVLQDRYLRAGDVLRREFPDPRDLLRARSLLEEQLGSFRRLALFHWDYHKVKEHELLIQDLFGQ